MIDMYCVNRNKLHSLYLESNVIARLLVNVLSDAHGHGLQRRRPKVLGRARHRELLPHGAPAAVSREEEKALAEVREASTSRAWGGVRPRRCARKCGAH